jgi:peptidoglycan/xylan/chitin deacetylase (PgdA/CDA1 family)
MTNETTSQGFWPDGIRLVVSVSMQFEAGGQPPKGTDSPFPPVEFPASVPSDAAANTWFAYGYREGIPRMLDLWDRHSVKVTSHMIGEAAQRHPELAREIVARGHEASGHGPRWSSQYAMSRDEERSISAVVVPYTLRNNDILLIEGRNYSPREFIEQIKMGFDQLYDEADLRRRMMSVSAHDRISGSPQMVRAWDEFLRYAKSRRGVVFLRKDEIARYALESPMTLRESETI